MPTPPAEQAGATGSWKTRLAVFGGAALLMGLACYLGMWLFFFLVWLLGDLDFPASIRRGVTWTVTGLGALAMGLWALAEEGKPRRGSSRRRGRRRS